MLHIDIDVEILSMYSRMTLHQRVEEAKVLVRMFEKGVEENAIFSKETANKVLFQLLKNKDTANIDKKWSHELSVSTCWITLIKSVENILGINYSLTTDSAAETVYKIQPNSVVEMMNALKDLVTRYEAVTKKTISGMRPH